MGIGINMSFCGYAELRDNKWYCLGTKEIDSCPANGCNCSTKCYYQKQGNKEIHFYYDLDVIPNEVGYFTDWKETTDAILRGDEIIRTTQMGILTYSVQLFEWDYRIFIYDEGGEFELTIGDCARTNREIRLGHNHFKMWVSGEFTNYEKESNNEKTSC